MISRSDFAALADRNFRRYWTGQAVSSFGDGMIPVVTAFAVLQAGGSPAALGFVLAAGATARVIATLAGGVIADRMPRRKVMMAADSTRCAVEALVGFLMLAGVLAPWGLGIANVVYGAAAGFFGPASRGLVTAVIDRRLLQQASALMSLARSSSMVIGPAVAGLMIPWHGTGPAYLVDGVTFAVNVVMLSRVNVTEESGRPRKSFVGDLVYGWREVLARRWLRSSLVVHSLYNFGIAAFFVLGPVIVDRHLGGALAWGLVSAALSAGAFLGAAVSLRWRPGRPLLVGNMALACAVLPLAALAARGPVLLLAAATLLFNSGLTLLNELWTVTTQQLIPDDVLARVSSWDWLLSLVTLPIGYAIVGPVASATGDTAALVSGIVLTSVPVFALCALPSVRRIRMRRDGVIYESDAPQPEAVPVYGAEGADGAGSLADPASGGS